MGLFGNREGGGGFGCAPRVLLAGVLVVMAFTGYYCNTQRNPITGEKQHVSLTPDQETRLGLQAAPEMVEQMGGEMEGPGAALVREVGSRLAANVGGKNPYPFKFHLLADPQTINAFALPGGQVFITRALFERLETEAQLAGVLGHEIGHVVHRHGAQHMANAEFYQKIAGAAAVGSGDYSAGQVAQYVAQIRMLKYGREDELESDNYGLQLMTRNGFDPRAQAQVMEILKQASGGTARGPNFLSTHPDPEARIVAINAWIAKNYPSGIPKELGPGRRLRAGGVSWGAGRPWGPMADWRLLIANAARP